MGLIKKLAIAGAITVASTAAGAGGYLIGSEMDEIHERYVDRVQEGESNFKYILGAGLALGAAGALTKRVLE